MVASPKGVAMNSNQTRPSTANDDDDLWMSDDISFSNYPREPPNNAYNVVPPLSESSYPPSIPPSLPRNVQNPKPPAPRQLVKRREKVNVGESKRSRIKKPTLKKKQKKRVKANLSLPPTTEPVITQDPDHIIEAQNAPLSDSPPPQPSKREQDSNELEGLKKKRIDNKERENDRLTDKKLAGRRERKKKRWEILKRFREQTVPLDQAAMAQYRLDEKEAKRRRRQRVVRSGQSPSPPRQRERTKRKYQIPEGTTLVHYKRIKGPSSKKKAEQLSKAWSEKLNILRGRKEGTKKWALKKPTQEDINLRKVKGRTISKKWATKKPTQEDINRFKPSLW
ncbi:unnamed protein product [Meloidogyne enterolobii]